MCSQHDKRSERLPTSRPRSAQDLVQQRRSDFTFHHVGSRKRTASVKLCTAPTNQSLAGVPSPSPPATARAFTSTSPSAFVSLPPRLVCCASGHLPLRQTGRAASSPIPSSSPRKFIPTHPQNGSPLHCCSPHYITCQPRGSGGKRARCVHTIDCHRKFIKLRCPRTTAVVLLPDSAYPTRLYHTAASGTTLTSRACALRRHDLLLTTVDCFRTLRAVTKPAHRNTVAPVYEVRGIKIKTGRRQALAITTYYAFRKHRPVSVTVQSRDVTYTCGCPKLLNRSGSNLVPRRPRETQSNAFNIDETTRSVVDTRLNVPISRRQNRHTAVTKRGGHGLF